MFRRSILIVLGTLVGSVPAVFSCSQFIVPFPYKLKRSRLAVVGKVIEVRGEPGRRVATFEIHETLKGDAPSQQLELPFKETLEGPCPEKVEYRAGATHLLLYSGTAAGLEPYPTRFDSTPGRTAENVRSCLRILEAEALDEKRTLYRSIFESSDPVFLKDALDGLKLLRADDNGITENVLLGALASSTRSEDSWMVPELVRIGSRRAVRVFVSLSTGSGDNELRLPAIDALGLLGAREAVRALKDLAERDVHGPVRKKAIESLARIGNSGVAEFLRSRLSSEQDPSVRGSVLEQLAALAHPAAAELATSALDATAQEERQGAYRALGRLRLRESLPELKRRLGSAAISDKPWIAAALVEIDPAGAAPSLVHEFAGGAARWMPELLGKTGSDAARKALLEFMARELSSGPGRTPALLEPLLALGGSDAIASVLDLAENPNHFLRAKAMQALGKFRIAGAFERLAAGLSDSVTGGEAADALVQIDYERALPVVLGWLTQDEQRGIPSHFLAAVTQRRDRRVLELIESRIRKMPDSEHRDMLARVAEAIRSGH